MQLPWFSDSPAFTKLKFLSNPWTQAANSYHEILPKCSHNTMLGQAPSTRRFWAMCNHGLQKIKETCAANSKNNNSPKITQKLNVGPSSTYQWSLSHVQLTTTKKIKETPATSSNNKNSPKLLKNLSWTKPHPPTKFEPHATYCLRMKPGQTNKKRRIAYYYLDWLTKLYSRQK